MKDPEKDMHTKHPMNASLATNQCRTSKLSLGLMAALLARGVDCVLRLRQARRHDLRQGQSLGKNDPLVHWCKGSAEASPCERKQTRAEHQHCTRGLRDTRNTKSDASVRA